MRGVSAVLSSWKVEDTPSSYVEVLEAAANAVLDKGDWQKCLWRDCRKGTATVQVVNFEEADRRRDSLLDTLVQMSFKVPCSCTAIPPSFSGCQELNPTKVASRWKGTAAGV